jgi:hypothetical protein
MHFPTRVRSALYGILLLGAGGCFLYMAVLAWNGTIVFPEDCSRSRRVLGCHVWNGVYWVGGAAGVGSLFALFGLMGLAMGARFVLGRARLRDVE